MEIAAPPQSASQGYTAGELMVAAAAREIRDSEIVFVGMRLPLLAFAVAKRTHAPSAIGLFENGIIRETPARELLYTMADPPNLAARNFCRSDDGRDGIFAARPRQCWIPWRSGSGSLRQFEYHRRQARRPRCATAWLRRGVRYCVPFATDGSFAGTFQATTGGVASRTSLRPDSAQEILPAKVGVNRRDCPRVPALRR